LLVAFVDAPPSSAHRVVTRAVSYRYTAHVTKTATLHGKITETARSGSPAIVRTLTATVTVTGRGSAMATRTHRVKASASTAARARALAKSRARAWAVSHAVARATSLARSRALAAATRASAAVVTARKKSLYASALAAAKAAAAKRAAATGTVKTPPPVKTPAPVTTPTPAPTPTPSDPTVDADAPCGAETVGAGWTCTFDDEFSGTALDRTKWVPVTSATSGLIAGGSAAAMGCYVDSPDTISVGGGHLDLTVRREDTPVRCRGLGDTFDFDTPYTAGQVATSGLFSQTYGRYEIRAKFPASTAAGLHSALWMWPQGFATAEAPGEIDIAEDYSVIPGSAFATLHYGKENHQMHMCPVADPTSYHVYGLVWTPKSVSIQYDGVTCMTEAGSDLDQFGISPYDQSYFLTLTQTFGVGTNVFDPDTTPLPATMSVDWVRVWAQQPTS